MTAEQRAAERRASNLRILADYITACKRLGESYGALARHMAGPAPTTATTAATS